MRGGRHRTHSPRHMPEQVTRGSPSVCPQQEHGAVEPLPALGPPLCPPLLCTPPPPCPAPFLQPSQLLLSLPCQALCHGSWLVSLPSLRSPACRTRLLRLEPALTLAWTRLTPARQPSTWSPSQVRTHSWWLCPAPLQAPPPVVTLSLLGSVSHTPEQSLLRGAAPPESRTQPGPASVPTAWDACQAPSHLGASGPSGLPGPQGNGSYSRVGAGKRNETPPRRPASWHGASSWEWPLGAKGPRVRGCGLVRPSAGSSAHAAASHTPHCSTCPKCQAWPPHTDLAGGRYQATYLAIVPAGAP